MFHVFDELGDATFPFHKGKKDIATADEIQTIKLLDNSAGVSGASLNKMSKIVKGNTKLLGSNAK